MNETKRQHTFNKKKHQQQKQRKRRPLPIKRNIYIVIGSDWAGCAGMRYACFVFCVHIDQLSDRRDEKTKEEVDIL